MPADASRPDAAPEADFLTPEERQTLRDLPKRMRARRIPAQLRDEKRLRPWMQIFAYWLAFAPFKTTVGERRIKASELARDQVSNGQVRVLLARADFRALMEKYQAGGVEGALEKLKADLPFYVDLHREGAEMARADGNYAVIPKYTLHALEIVAPRRNDLGQQNVQVNVTFSAKQLALEETPPLEVTVTPIATPSE